MSVNSKNGFDVFSGVTGSIKTGEMTLVLGTPGSGKSTLLRVLAGRLNGEDVLNGSVKLNGTDVSTKSHCLRRLSTFVSDRDTNHAAELTVRSRE
eukprot:Pgem_evm1s3158